MFFQSHDGYCGTASVANALTVIGVSITSDDIKNIKRIAKTTVKNGTSRRGIIRAIKHYNKHPIPYYSKVADNAWKWIKRWSSEVPIVVLVNSDDGWGHWVTVVGRNRRGIIVVDPSRPDEREDNGSIQNGVHPMRKSEFMSQWKWNSTYYAIKVT